MPSKTTPTLETRFSDPRIRALVRERLERYRPPPRSAEDEAEAGEEEGPDGEGPAAA